MNSIIDIIPALIAFTITGVILVYFLKMNSSIGIIICSFSFIFSGFLVQLIYNNYDKVKQFSIDNRETFNIPILSTIISIFIGNRLLKLVADNKDKKETAIILKNSVDSQLRSIAFINSYLTPNLDDDNNDLDLQCIQIYKNRLLNNKLLQTTYGKMGIYDELIINLISQYSVKEEEYISYLDRYLLKDNNKKKLLLLLCKVEGTITFLFGILLVSTLEIRYCNIKREDKIKSMNLFIDDYEKRLLYLKKFLEEIPTVSMNSFFPDNLIKALKEVERNYKKLNRFFLHNKLISRKVKSFYIIKNFIKNNPEKLLYLTLANSEKELKNYLSENNKKFNNVGLQEYIKISLE